METDEPQPGKGRKLSHGKMLGSVAHAMNFHLGIVVGLLALFLGLDGWRFGLATSNALLRTPRVACY